ncbi:MAG: chemotaxis protein CheD [Candidatus Heimdallarchaeota archaeon]
MDENLVNIGQIRTAKSPTILQALALGSCVGITIWDPIHKIGSLAHAVLPALPPSKRKKPRPQRYVISAIAIMLEEMRKLGSDTLERKLEAKLVGGANMFPKASLLDVGTRNVQVARTRLRELGVPLVAEETGKDFGRTMAFSCQDGSIEITRAGGKLWKKL